MGVLFPRCFFIALYFVKKKKKGIRRKRVYVYVVFLKHPLRSRLVLNECDDDTVQLKRPPDARWCFYEPAAIEPSVVTAAVARLAMLLSFNLNANPLPPPWHSHCFYMAKFHVHRLPAPRSEYCGVWGHKLTLSKATRLASYSNADT